MKFFLSVIILTLSFTALHAQKYLLFKKIGSKKRFEMHIGDELKYKSKIDNEIYKEVINDLILKDSLVFFQNRSVHLKDIKAIYVSNRRGILNTIGKFSIRIGAIYLFADTFNAAINNDTFFTDEVLARSGSFISFGLLLNLLRKNKFRIGGNNRLLIIDIY